MHRFVFALALLIAAALPSNAQFTPGIPQPVVNGQCIVGSGGQAVWGSCSGSGTSVSSVSNSDGTTTVSPTTGDVVVQINLAHANTWSGKQTFVGPALGTPASGDASNFTNIPVNQAIGNLSVNRLNSGTNADSTHFWRGDGTWAVPPGGSSSLAIGSSAITGGTGTNRFLYDNGGTLGEKLLASTDLPGVIDTTRTANYQIASTDMTNLVNLGGSGGTAITIPNAAAGCGTTILAPGQTVAINTRSATGNWTVTNSCSATLTYLGPTTLVPGTYGTLVANVDGATLDFVGLTAPTTVLLGGSKAIAASGSQFLTGLGTDGVYTRAQPAFTDLSGVAAAAQIPVATTSANGGVKVDGSTIVISGGVISAPGSGGGTVGNCTTADALAYYAATGTTTSCLPGVGTSGQVLTSNGAGVAPTFQAATGGGTLNLNYIGGCVLSNDGGTPNSILDIAACQVTDSTNAEYIPTLAAFTKSTAGAFATGTGSNGMGGGLTIANSTWYHIFAIDCSTGGAHGDIYFDTSVTAANIPACATKFRRLGSFKTNGSAQILAFKQRYDIFIWGTPNEAATNQTYTTTPTTLTLTGNPPGVVTEAHLQVYTGSDVGNTLGITDPTSSQTVANGGPACGNSTLGAGISCALDTTTNTSSQVTVTSSNASAPGNYIRTISYRDYRGQ